MKKVYVEWWDAISEDDNAWTPADELGKGLALCYSLGFLVKETETFVCIAGHTGEKFDEVSGSLCIPTSCIKRIREVIVQND